MAETTARVRDACGVPWPQILGPTWVETPKDPPTGTKLGPNRNALGLVFSVSHARK